MNKKIYLTIDDSPSKDFRANLDYLIEHNIPAVFFCIGNRMEAGWEDLKYAISKGYLIGNHSYTHPQFSDLDIDVAKEEIQKTDALIERLYQEAGQPDYDRLFRFPYGDKGDGKFGLQFMSHYEAEQEKQSRFDRLVKWINSLHPVDKQINDLVENQKGEMAEELQRYLFQLGYVRGDLTGVEYNFFHRLQTDQDWSWTFDIGEWRWDGKQNQDTFLAEIKSRLESDAPEDFRGPVRERVGIQQKYFIDLVLFHDRDESNTFFKPIIDMLLEMQVEFLPIDYDQIKQS